MAAFAQNILSDKTTIIILLIVLVSAIIFGKKGLYESLMPIIVFFISIGTGIYAIKNYSDTIVGLIAPWFEGIIKKSIPAPVYKIVIFLIIISLVSLVLNVFKKLLGKIVNFSIFGILNHVLGFIFGALLAVIVIFIVLRVLGLFGINILPSSFLSDGLI